MKRFVRLPALSPLCLSLLLVACGGSGGNSPAAAPSVVPPVNVALPANGATVSATFGDGSTANFVNDGDSTTTTNFWAANVAGDSVTIFFGRVRQVSEVTVYTNDTSFNAASPKKTIEVSADGTVWKTTAQPSGGEIDCSTFTADSVKIRCVFASPQSLSRFRVRVTDVVAPSAQNIIEMEALGT